MRYHLVEIRHRWRGVTLDTLLQAAGLEAPTPWVLAHSQDGYSTNVPLADLTQGRAMIATHYDDRPLAPEHGDRHACWCRISTSGSRPSGSMRCSSTSATRPGSGNCGAITCEATLSRKSAMDEAVGQHRLSWQTARIDALQALTPRVMRVVLRPDRWVRPRPGQHLDVRLTAEDGYQAQRSYSLLSPPQRTGLYELGIERLDDGEVSTWFHDKAQHGETIEVLGPVGGHFVLDESNTRPALLIGEDLASFPFCPWQRNAWVHTAKRIQRCWLPHAILTKCCSGPPCSDGKRLRRGFAADWRSRGIPVPRAHRTTLAALMEPMLLGHCSNWVMWRPNLRRFSSAGVMTLSSPSFIWSPG